MSRSVTSKLGPAPGGGTFWYVPNRKRPVAQTTTATSDSMTDLVRDHGVTTFDQMHDRLLYDTDGQRVCEIMSERGLGDRLLTFGHHGIRIGTEIVPQPS